MDKPYKNIPRQGSLPNVEGGPDHKTTTSVRAQPAPDATRPSGPASATYQLLHHEEEGQYRLRAWKPDAEITATGGYAELKRYTTQKELTAGLEELPDEPRFIVLENTETGEVYFGRENNLSDDWMEGGRFDQVTLFGDETEAAAYAEARDADLNDD